MSTPSASVNTGVTTTPPPNPVSEPTNPASAETANTIPENTSTFMVAWSSLATNSYGSAAARDLPRRAFRPGRHDAVYAGVSHQLAHVLVGVNDDAEVNAIHRGPSEVPIVVLALQAGRLYAGMGGYSEFR
jgi:hypothetical protein